MVINTACVRVVVACRACGSAAAGAGPARLVAVAEDNTRLREVNARLREVVEAQAVQLEVLKRQQQALSRRVEELERKTGKDSSNSGKPPSSDPVWDKKSAGKKGTRRSLRERGARSPGKQPGAGSSTLKLVDDPDETDPQPAALNAQGCGGDSCRG